MVLNADVIVSFKTYPHIDMYETGEHAGRLLFEQLAGKVRPIIAWHRLPLISHTLQSATEAPAMHKAVQAARAAESDGLLAVSVLAGFGLADIPFPCISVVVVADGDAAKAQQAADALASQIWRDREGFCYEGEPLDQSISRAHNLGKSASRPILLLDHGDNCMSGGTCDTMDVLSAALDQGLEGILAGLYCDPETVAGAYRPQHAGGDATRHGAGTLVLTERTHEPWDLGVFESLGQNPREAGYLLLKSRMYCRPVFVPISDGLVECDSPGATSADWTLFPFQRRAQPLYPLENVGPNAQDYAPAITSA